MAVEPQLWIDGRPASADDLRQMAIVNYGAVTSFNYADGGVRGLDLHMERLAASARELFQLSLDESSVRNQLRAALDAVDAAWVRVTLTAPSMSLRAPEAVERLAVGIWVSPPAAPMADGLRVMTMRHQRELAHLKHLGTTGVIHARRKARLAGYDDALLTGEVGLILEGTLWNIGFLQGNRVVWPEGTMLDGVTRRLISGGLENTGVTQVIRPVSLGDLEQFDGAFACNAATPAASIASINDYVLGSNPDAIARLRQAWESQPVQSI